MALLLSSVVGWLKKSSLPSEQVVYSSSNPTKQYELCSVFNNIHLVPSVPSRI
jgi:hypothetical protein